METFTFNWDLSPKRALLIRQKLRGWQVKFGTQNTTTPQAKPSLGRSPSRKWAYMCLVNHSHYWMQNIRVKCSKASHSGFLKSHARYCQDLSSYSVQQRDFFRSGLMPERAEKIIIPMYSG